MFQCFECQLISDNEAEIKAHLRIVHNLKVEVEALDRKLCCSECSFETRDMGEYKCHVKSVHKKEEHNLIVEGLKAVFS